MRFGPAFLSLLAPFALISCADPQPLYVDQGWISLASDPEKPSAGYFVIHGGEAPVTLMGVQTEAAQRIDMHESMMKDGMSMMQPITSVDVPAKSEVAFAPGGKHLMLFGINPGAVKQGKLTMTLIFSNGDRIIIDSVIRKQGGAEPVSDAHKSH